MSSALSNSRTSSGSDTNGVAPLEQAPPPLTGPDRARRLGTIARDCPPIFISEPVLDEILEYSDSQEIGEVGGFLLGGYYVGAYSGKPQNYVEIKEFLPATGVSNTYRSLTFTHETWANLHRQIQEQFPDLQVVGWQHTHPGFGIFLSRHDLFIHRSFFSQPWQIAMVVDPRNLELGFFQWQDDKIVNSGFLCVPANSKVKRQQA